MLRKILAENIKRIRVEKNLSQEKLAEECDLHRTYISLIEREKRNVSIDTIERIAEALDVPAVNLLKS